MPDSFQTFLTHAIQADLQRRLWTDEHIDNRIVEGTPCPPAFSAEIARIFSRLMSEYRSIQGHKLGSPPKLRRSEHSDAGHRRT